MTDGHQTVIFFIRHGETDRTYSPDPATDDLRRLSERGRKQLQRVGEYLAEFVPDVIYTSPRRRTVESAELIAASIQPRPPIEKRVELFEVYSNEDYQALERRIPALFAELVGQHPGRQIVCVSHQDVIQGGLDALNLTSAEKAFPCQMGEGYRLVFADTVLVECRKIRPAHEI